MIPLQHYLIVGALLFCLGMAIFLSKKNAIAALMGIELMLNAANINLVAFSQYDADKLAGQMFSLFVIVVAAAETAVGLAIIILVYSHYKTANLDEVNNLKEPK